jgi:HTH-type transcriptional regulator/antitoxin HipB
LLVGLRRQRGLSQKLLAPKAGGLNQARLSALELHPGRFTVERLLMILAAQADTRVSDLVFRTAGVTTAV